MKWIGMAGAAALVISCFLPWYRLDWLGFTLTGLEADKFGKPAYWHFVFSFFYLLFSFIPRIWAKQWNLFFSAGNLAWALRNFFVIAICSGGECPERQLGIWLILIASILMLFGAFFPGVKLKERN